MLTWTVYCLDRLSAPADEFHESQHRLAVIYGGSLNYDRVDVTSSSDVDYMIEKIARENGLLDGLVAAAGVQKVVPALEYPPEAIMEMMEINYKGK